MTVLVVGANGQLGAATCRALQARGHAVRGSVRDPARAADLEGVELVTLDLQADRLPDGLLEGVEAVVLSANNVAPRPGDDLDRFEGGVNRLVEAAGSAGVSRIVLPSMPASRVDDSVPLTAGRHELEARVLAAVPGSVLLRFAPFMEPWFALVGSSLTLRGDPHATVGRPSPFLHRFRAVAGSTVERRGLMLVPGPVTHRHAFLAEADAAAACAAAVSAPDAGGRAVEVGGPEVLSWVQVAEIFTRVLGRRVRAVSTPEAVFTALAAVTAPFAIVPSRTFALNRLMAASETPWTTGGGGLVEPSMMTTAEDLLRGKAALSEALPEVV